MKTYKYLDPEQKVVAVVDDDGVVRVTGLASVLVPDGVAAEPYIEPPAPIPTVVSMRKARLALRRNGLLDQVDTVIAGLPSPQREEAQIEWEYATEVVRTSPITQMIAIGLSLTEAQMDDLFTLAETL